ncbi:hypothetical protein E1301_Tti018576 [Triplophysa tibetana]|uniref:Uncharacterized protein n=1 Tax=Triplophysa tibetana TaxID=1572043 RepID=A0A5A9N665_9TELE|nr:hypothetical protein E1301_Tti018576 [Triplophysa tibetana]
MPETTGELLRWKGSPPLQRRWGERKTLAPLEPKAATRTGKKQAALKGEAGIECAVQPITPASVAGAQSVVSLNLSALRQQAAESDRRVLEITLKADRYGSVRSGDIAMKGCGGRTCCRDEIELQFAPVTGLVAPTPPSMQIRSSLSLRAVGCVFREIENEMLLKEREDQGGEVSQCRCGEKEREARGKDSQNTKCLNFNTLQHCRAPE